MNLNFSKINLIVLLSLTLLVIFNSIKNPLHNFDEIPYSYLTSNVECNSERYISHIKYMELNNQLINVRNKKIMESDGESFRKTYISDPKYFCSSLPMYSSKKLYILLARAINKIIDNPLISLRVIASSTSAIWFFLIGFKIVEYKKSNQTLLKIIPLLILYKLAKSIGIISTPDGLATLLFSISIIFLNRVNIKSINSNIKVKANSKSDIKLICISSFFGFLAFITRANLIIPIFFSFILLKIIGYNIKRITIYYGLIFSSSLFLFNLTFNDILINQPDSYSFISPLMSTFGGLYGLTGPLNVYPYNITFHDILVKIDFYRPYIKNIVLASLNSIFPASLFYLKYTVGFILINSEHHSKKIRFLKLFFDKNYNVILILVMFSFLVQIILFPKFNLRLLTPFISMFLLFIINRKIAYTKLAKI